MGFPSTDTIVSPPAIVILPSVSSSGCRLKAGRGSQAARNHSHDQQAMRRRVVHHACAISGVIRVTSTRRGMRARRGRLR